jgi:ATPase subunit of ABC transporter with duplicated ATPase domains
VQSNQRKH